MATLKDIAKILNISTMTVSRAINYPDLVADDLRKEIFNVIEELDYKPNQAARSLVSKKTGVIQIVISKYLNSIDPYFMTLLAGIADYLSDNFYALTVRRDNDLVYKCDGMIVMGLKKGEDKLLNEEVDIPCVIFGKTEYDIDCIDINNRKGMYDATKYLIDLGHKDIAFVKINEYEDFSTERFEGYVEALKDNNLQVKDEYIFNSENNIYAGEQIGDKIFKTTKVSAIICSSDLLAIGVITSAKNLNIDIPKDISIIGFDGVYLNKMVIPHLTTVVQPVYDIGKNLAEVLLNRINNNDLPKSEIVYELELLDGDTTSVVNNNYKLL
ncbi:MAG: LacI family DNA-binding transcriptional regulator [Clostridiaceae bacterium]